MMEYSTLSRHREGSVHEASSQTERCEATDGGRRERPEREERKQPAALKRGYINESSMQSEKYERVQTTTSMVNRRELPEIDSTDLCVFSDEATGRTFNDLGSNRLTVKHKH